ncbi:MAG: hypothetical protein HUU46_00935 [Candidatus Hydrogenedentes bacterium]|nr:hypothetical protein [Candidatus Hydrogenedentota bacterium]
MTTREFINWVAALPSWAIAAAFVAPPVVAIALRFVHGLGEGARAPWRYVYALLVYWACLPGVFVAVVVGYMLFFTNENLLDQNVLLYIFPPVSMVVTLMLIRKNVSFDDVPGFDRLSGLIAVIAVTFVIILAVQKTRLWLVFGGSIFVLTAIVMGLIGVLQWGLYALFRRSDEPSRKRPRIDIPNGGER